MPHFANALRSHGRGDLAAAESNYLATLSKDTRHVEALRLLGLLYHQQGKNAFAVCFLERALALNPTDVTILLDLGALLKLTGHLDRAIELLAKAVSIAPRTPGAHANLGDALLAAGRMEDAIDSFRSAVRQDPGDVLALNRLGGALQHAGRARDALVAFRSAIAMERSSVTAEVGAGTSLCSIENYEAAIDHFKAAIELDTRCAPAWYNLGCAKLGLGDYQAAEGAFSQALVIRPDWPAARLNRALTWLSAGDFGRGLPEFEWRLKAIRHDNGIGAPRWDGSNLPDKTLAIHAEQGFGDTLQFLRFAPEARKRVSSVSLRVQRELASLLQPLGVAWDIKIDTVSDDLPAPDAACSLMSLPHILGATMDSRSVAQPYIHVPDAYRAKWQGALSGLHRKKVGLAWSGNLRTYDIRALPLQHLGALLATEAIDWIILQREIPRADLTYLEASPEKDRIHQFQYLISDFADTAALIDQLDVVVTVDTSIAHLAGAMGKSVIVMLPFAADWRWRIDQQTSRWYKSARLAWQHRPADWGSVVAQVSRLLGPEPVRNPSNVCTLGVNLEK